MKKGIDVAKANKTEAVAGTAVAELEQVRTSGLLDFTEGDAAAAGSLGIVMSGSLEERIGRAIYAFNSATRYAVEAGYLLLSVKKDVVHGEFEPGIEALGLTKQRAFELMRMAKFATALPADRRAEMLMLPKSKVLALAGADSAVIEDLLDAADGDVDLVSLSVRELRQRIRELEAKNTDLAVSRDTAAAERDGLAKQLRKRRQAAEDQDGGVPVVVADIRAEGADLLKKAELAVASLHPLGAEIAALGAHSEGVTWAQPTFRLVLSGLVALRLQIDGEIQRYVDAIDDAVGNLVQPPEALAFLDEAEVQALAEEWAKLTSLHAHEAALRAHERDSARPKGKGRPKAAPKASGAQA